MQGKTPPSWLNLVAWAPVLIYFGVKYLVIGYENITTRQSFLLLGAVILAEVALWQYRKSFRGDKKPEGDGTNQER